MHFHFGWFQLDRNGAILYGFFFFFFEMKSCSVSQAGVQWHNHNLHLLSSSYSSASASQVAGITDARHHALLILVFLVEVGFHHVGQAGLELLTSNDLPASTSQNAGLQVWAIAPVYNVFLNGWWAIDVTGILLILLMLRHWWGWNPPEGLLT